MELDFQMRFLFVLVLGSSVNYGKADENYCYTDDKDPYVQFGSKTAYEVARAQKSQAIPSCKPITLWASIRHGTRYPSKETIERMKTLLDVRDQILKNHEVNKEGQLCSKDLLSLKNWNYLLSPTYENRLSTQGKDDLRFLAKRLKSQFSTIFDVYSSEKFMFYNDNTSRTIESTEAFVEGLFGSENANVYKTSNILKPSESCEAWVNRVGNNSENMKEYELFRQSSYIQDLISEVDRRLGFRYNLTLDIIELMYDTCRYEKAWYISSKPPFCSAFSQKNLEILEYMEDLKYYYRYSYGDDLNKRLACPLVSDLFSRFKDVAEGNNKSGTRPTGVFYFSYSDIHIPSLAYLNIKEDSQPLLHNNFNNMSHREFMTSIIDPFSANLVAVFYKCITGEENRVMFYLNEQVVRYPGCDVGLCSWDYLYNKFKNDASMNSCNFEFCSTGHSSRIVSSFTSLLATMLLLVSFSQMY